MSQTGTPAISSSFQPGSACQPAGPYQLLRLVLQRWCSLAKICVSFPSHVASSSVGLCSADSPPPRRRILRCSQILVRMMARDGHVTIFIREHRSWREFAAVSLKCMCRSSCTKGHPERTLVRKTGPCFRNPLMHALHEQAICGKTAT